MRTTTKTSNNSTSAANTARQPEPISPSAAQTTETITKTTNIVPAAARTKINAKPEEEKKTTHHVRNKSTP